MFKTRVTQLAVVAISLLALGPGAVPAAGYKTTRFKSEIQIQNRTRETLYYDNSRSEFVSREAGLTYFKWGQSRHVKGRNTAYFSLLHPARKIKPGRTRTIVVIGKGARSNGLEVALRYSTAFRPTADHPWIEIRTRVFDQAGIGSKFTYYSNKLNLYVDKQNPVATSTCRHVVMNADTKVSVTSPDEDGGRVVNHFT